MTRMYEATHKQWNHTGYVVPEVEQNAGDRPAIELKPAAWLPVQRYDTKVEEYSVVAAGKPIAQDKDQRAVPAGLKLAFQAAGGSTILTYTATDYERQTVDLTTGVAYAVNGTTNYTQTQVTTALQAQGKITASEYARDFISWPIGYAPYTYWQWCGGDGSNPAEFRVHNHSLQHLVACGTDRFLQIPMVPAAVSAETQGGGLAIADTAITFGTAAWKSSTGLHATTKYASLVAAGDSVVAMVLDKYPVAKITANTPISVSAGTLASMTEVDSIAAVLAGGSGYFYIDYSVGVLFLFEPGGNQIPHGFDAGHTITYYSYESAATGSANIAQVLGSVRIGDFVTFDSTSNYVKWVPDIGTAFGGSSGAAFAADPDYGSGSDADISAQLEAALVEARGSVLGQVVEIMTFPRSGVEKVMTMYHNLTAFEKMPGTATAGMTDSLVQSGGANQVAVINFFAR